MERTVYIALGSNLGDKAENLTSALRLLEAEVGKLLSRSHFYETAPVGFVSEHTFLNAVAAFQTSYSPDELLFRTQAIEKQLGRLTKSHNLQFSDRLIDIDLLLLDHCCVNNSEAPLVLPHPRLHRRLFVLQPLQEIAPDLIHPIFQLSVNQLLNRLTDGGVPQLTRMSHCSPVEAADLAALREQLQGRPCSDCTEQINELLASPCACLYALKRPQGAIMGTATLSFTPLLTGRKAWIDDVVVDESLRGQGWGRRLVEHLIGEARRLGADAVQLTSRPEREAANRLYRSLGFNLRQTNVYQIKF